MNSDRLTRRGFLADAGRVAAGSLLALQIPWLASLTACESHDASGDGALTTLTATEAATMRAFAAQILPADDMPGAVELGAVRFADRALATPYFAPSLRVVRAGLADLDARARRGYGRSFAALPAGDQVAVMKSVEGEPFFAAARTLVLTGAFAEPSYGGNRGGAGWTMIGIDHRPSYTAPYGWYDAQAAGAAGGKA